jgi:hypothetical protein
MHTYLQTMMAWEAWKGNRPGFGSFLANYYERMLLPLWDSDRGGSEKFIDAQFYIIGSGSSNPPQEADPYFGANVAKGFQSCSAGYNAPYPPTQTAFVRGLATQGQHILVLWSGHFDSNSYALTTRALCTFGSLAGIAVYDKILTRINALIVASSTPPGYTGFVTTGGNRNGLMWAVSKS